MRKSVFAVLKSSIEAQGYHVVPRTEETSDRIASIAGRGLDDPTSLTPEEIRAVCGSAVTQAPAKAD